MTDLLTIAISPKPARPRSVTLALCIICLSAAGQIGCFAGAIWFGSSGNGDYSRITLAQIVAPVFVPLFLAAFMRTGANWPRFVYATLTVLTAPWVIIFQGWLGVLYYTLFVGKAVSAVLLFLPRANAWFAPRRASGEPTLSNGAVSDGLKAAKASAPRPATLKLAICLLMLVIIGTIVVGALDLYRSGVTVNDQDASTMLGAFIVLLAMFLAINVLAASAIVLLLWLGRGGARYVFATLLAFWLPLITLNYGITNLSGALLSLTLIASTILLFHPQSRQWFDTLQTRAAVEPHLQQPTASND